MDGICSRCSVLATAYSRYYEANIPAEYWDFPMAEYKGPESYKKLYENVTGNLPVIYEKGFSFAMLSGHGVGKTTLATSILRRAVEKNYNCLYITLSDLVNVLIEAPYEEKFAAKKELAQVDILTIDELDSRFFATSEATATMFGKSLENIIRTRFSNKLPNIFVSNSPNMIEGFTGSFKDSLASLMNGVKMYPAVGQDFRKVRQDKKDNQ